MTNRIFISYRRKGADVTAKLISETLKNKGYSTFYDYDGLKGGTFDDKIVQEILNCTDMVLVLPPKGLDRCRKAKDWVRQEISIALQNGKNIIPVMLDGFDFPETLPDDIAEVRRYNGVRFHMDYFDAVIDKIIEKLSVPGSVTVVSAMSKSVSGTPIQPVNDGIKRWKTGDSYVSPTLSLLNVKTESNNTVPPSEIDETSNKLDRILNGFKINARILGCSCGATVSRYELTLGEGTRLNQIKSIESDITIALGVQSIRIEAPIPGTTAIGIEVPNAERTPVYLHDVMSEPEFINSAQPLKTCLGQTFCGESELMDISKMPHVLIAGSTGTGKTVQMECIILSLLYRNSPDDLKLILIDPRQVEYNAYSQLPHLLMPVIYEPLRAAAALEWVLSEMDRRYELLQRNQARNRDEYLRKTAYAPDREPMPNIVILIDELSDLMLQAREQIEPLISRIAAKSRAAGIHLIIGTQRPTVDVLTGVIKANIPSRIGFSVTSQMDARVIDLLGAEKLLGKGDMLYCPTGRNPIRIQGAYVSYEETVRVIDHIISHNGQASFDQNTVSQVREAYKLLLEQLRAAQTEEEEGEQDPLFLNAVETVVENESASTSLLQRKLEIGYSRATRILEALEKKGVVSPPNGSKPRDVLLTRETLSLWLLEQRCYGNTYDNEEDTEIGDRWGENCQTPYVSPFAPQAEITEAVSEACKKDNQTSASLPVQAPTQKRSIAMIFRKIGAAFCALMTKLFKKKGRR